jgi:hypothetical protein
MTSRLSPAASVARTRASDGEAAGEDEGVGVGDAEGAGVGDSERAGAGADVDGEEEGDGEEPGTAVQAVRSSRK